MSEKIDVKVPDIGDFSDVEIIEVLVSAGDTVKAEDPLITLESDKASMDVPSPADGTIEEMTVKVGDKVSEGSVIARLTPADDGGDEATGDEATGDDDTGADGNAKASDGSDSPDEDTASEDARDDRGNGDEDSTPKDGGETIEVKVPDIGDFEAVEIIEVLVSAGDAVEAESPLITLESDKATMDVPSPAKGKIEEVTVKVGDKVSEGSVIARLSGGDAPSAPKSASKGSSAPEKASDEAPKASSGSGQGDGGSGADEDDAPVDPSRRGPPAGLPPPVERAGGALPHASPGVRRFARELGADLNQIRGSGPKGRILKDDVKAFVKQRLSEPAGNAAGAAVPGAGIPAMPEVDFSKFGEVEIKDTPRIKKISGAHLHRAWLNIPHVTHHDEADITELEAFRQAINEEQAKAKSGIKLTLLAFAMKALARALKEFPLFNSSLTPDGSRIVYKQYVHIGIAVDTPNGLVVPVFRDVDAKGVLALAEEMAEISGRARDGKLKPAEMQGGCMSISSLGGIGGTAFTPIVNAPEVAILGLTRNRMTPVWNGSEFEPRLMLPMDLSYDHRVIDGAEAARFTAYLGKALADPRRLLL